MNKIFLIVFCFLNTLLYAGGRRDAVSGFARSKSSDQTVYYILGAVGAFVIIFIIYTALKKK